MCEELFKVQQVHLDHKEPVVPLNNPLQYMEIDWNEYIPRLFCEVEDFQVLCINCHDAKTQLEDQMRSHYSQIKKEKKALDKKKKKE